MVKGLTKRDLALFECVHGYGTLSTGQIRKLHFANVNRKTALRRLGILHRRKWIEPVSHWERGEFVWRLTPKTAKLLGSDFVVNAVNRNMLGHDLIVNDVRIAFERWGVGKSWKSGHFLKHVHAKKWPNSPEGKDNIPDWLCAMKSRSGFRTVALEVELHLKSRTRRVEVLRSYHENDNIKSVWYVFPNERFGAKLFESAESVVAAKPKTWLCWSLLDDVLCDFPNAVVHFQTGTLAMNRYLEIEDKGADIRADGVGTKPKAQENSDMT
jgi:hypothetical protein